MTIPFVPLPLFIPIRYPIRQIFLVDRYVKRIGTLGTRTNRRIISRVILIVSKFSAYQKIYVSIIVAAAHLVTSPVKAQDSI